MNKDFHLQDDQGNWHRINLDEITALRAELAECKRNLDLEKREKAPLIDSSEECNGTEKFYPTCGDPICHDSVELLKFKLDNCRKANGILRYVIKRQGAAYKSRDAWKSIAEHLNSEIGCALIVVNWRETLQEALAAFSKLKTEDER